MIKIIPTSEDHWLQERTKDITSTEVSCLFGVSPYLTEFELWHRKKSGVVVKSEGNQRTFWGLKLQDTIATALAEQEEFKIRKMNEYIRDPSLRIGSSFDFAILNNSDGTDAAILEIKNVDSLIYKQNWLETDIGVEAPLHIELQVQMQLAVSELDSVIIAALVGGNNLVQITRNRNERLIKAIKERATKFWESIDANKEPKPNFELDADFISKLYNTAQEGKILSTNQIPEIEQLARVYKDLSVKEKTIKTKKDALKAEILTHIKDAEKVMGSEFTISAGITKATFIEGYERKEFRNFKINFKTKK